MAEQPLGGQQAGLLVQDGPQELVGRAQPFHQQVALAGTDQAHGFGDGLHLVGDVDDAESCGIDVPFTADLADAGGIAHQGDLDETHPGRRRSRFDRMSVDRPGGRHPLADSLCLQFGIQLVKTSDHVIRLFSGCKITPHGVRAQTCVRGGEIK